jgi:predicted dehydrogenase
LVQAGAIGDVWQARYRAAHAGPRELGCSEYFCEWLFDPKRNGKGGAYIDYCCYGAVLASVMLGVPAEVTAVAGRFLKSDAVDDNAVLIMKYPRGIAIAEGSWTQIGDLTAYQTVLYGTTATLLVEPGSDGRLLRASSESPAGEALHVPSPPSNLRCATAHFVSAVQSNSPFLAMCDAQHGYDTQVILEAGIKSLATGATVRLS